MFKHLRMQWKQLEQHPSCISTAGLPGLSNGWATTLCVNGAARVSGCDIYVYIKFSVVVIQVA